MAVLSLTWESPYLVRPSLLLRRPPEDLYSIIYPSETHVKHKSREISICPIVLCRRCSNYISILDLTSGFNWLGKNNCKTRRETLKFWDFVRLISEVWRYFTKLGLKMSFGRISLVAPHTSRIQHQGWLCLRPANGRRRYFITTSLVGWVSAKNEPCNLEWASWYDKEQMCTMYSVNLSWLWHTHNPQPAWKQILIYY